MSTKSELLAIAKTFEIAGRHEMTKEQLEMAIAALQVPPSTDEDVVDGTENFTSVTEVDETTLITETRVSKDKVKEIVRRYPSLRERGPDGKVIRAGRNLSGNQPFKRKYYYLSLVNNDSADYQVAFNAAPKQVRDILTFMKTSGCTSFTESKTGPTIADLAKASGILVSKIESDALFAYYRRAMEVLGLIHAGSFSDEEVEDGALEEEIHETDGCGMSEADVPQSDEEETEE